MVYRVAQEAVTNAIRHARAASIDITLRASGNYLALSVRDDGRGLREASPESGGIRGMRERANLVDGTLKVISAPRAGTEVCLTIPLEAEIG